MVGLFVRLKLALLRNSLRSGWQRTVGLVLGALFALPIAVLGFAALAFGGRSANGAQPMVVLGCTFLFMSWITIPVLGFGTDETLDPARLTSFPLTRPQLMAGLLAASAIGIGPIATAIGLAGAIPGYARLGPGALVVVAAVVVEVLLCLAGSRAVITALARLLRTRRGRDLMAAAAAIIALSPQIVRLALPQPGTAGHPFAVDDLGPAAAVARWSPPGLAGQAMFDASRGRTLAGLAELLLAAGCLLLLVWWWGHSLERAMTTAEATAGRTREASQSRGRPGAPLLPRWLPFVAADRVGAMTAKELRYASRDPRRRIQILMGLLVPLVAMLPALAQGGIHHPAVVMVAVFVSFMFTSATSLNSLGVDGLPYWINVSAGNDPRADLLGKNIASVTLGLPLTALVACGLAALSGGWVYVPLVVCLGAAILGVGSGVGDVASVRAPQPVPDTSSPWGQNTGQGCAAGFLAMLAFATEVALLVPIAALVGVGFGLWRPMLLIVAPVAVVYGAVVWRAGLGMASRWAWWRLPELLEAISPKHA